MRRYNIIQFIHSNKIANRFIKVFSIDVLVKGASFLLLPVYLHLMTQSEVGSFNYIFSFLQTLTILFCFGLYTPQSKLYFDYHGSERGQLLFSINAILLIMLICILAPIYIFRLDFKIITFLFDHHIAYEQYRAVLLSALLVSVGNYMLFNYLLTSEKIRKVQIYNTLRLILDNCVVLSILYFSDGDKVFQRLSAYYVCEGIVLIGFLPLYIRNFKIRIDKSQIRRIFKLSIPMFATVIISTIYAFSDKYFIQEKTDMNILATYTTGLTIASVCALIIQSFQNIWLPLFFQEKDLQQNIQKTKKMIRIIIFSFTGISIFMILGVKVALEFNIIPMVYESVLIILPFLFLAQIISAVNTMWANYFAYFERMTAGTLIGGGAYIIGFVLNFLLIPRYGVTGAIISLLSGNIILATMVYLHIKKLRYNYTHL